MASSASHSPQSDPDLLAHAASYHHFMLAVKWAIVVLAAFLTFSTVAFATAAGVLAGLFWGVVVFVLGVFALTHGLAHSSESDNPPG